MKVMKILLMVLVCFAMSNAAAQKMADNSYEYDDGVNLTVVRFLNNKTATYGNGGDGRLYIAKGARFKMAIIEIENTSKEDVEIDFKQFRLLDKNEKQYHVSGVSQAMKMSMTNENFTMKLKAGKKKTYAVEFWPPYPKDEPVTRMLVDNNTVALKTDD